MSNMERFKPKFRYKDTVQVIEVGHFFEGRNGKVLYCDVGWKYKDPDGLERIKETTYTVNFGAVTASFFPESSLIKV